MVSFRETQMFTHESSLTTGIDAVTFEDVTDLFVRMHVLLEERLDLGLVVGELFRRHGDDVL